MTTQHAKPRNGGPGLHPENLGELEELLRRQMKMLVNDVLGLEKAWTDRSELDPHTSPAESGTDSYEDDVRLARMEAAGEEMNEIEQALGRIRQGTFGICEECGKPISLERLRAIPQARLCIACKQIEEAA